MTTISLAVLTIVATPSLADGPRRWRLTGTTTLPLNYFQGVAHGPGGSWFFDGVFVGLYRTDRRFRQTAAVADAIPAAVAAREGYNHIGDIAFDPARRRLLLPLECYYPPRGNTCGTGSFGVVDPRTLRWRYYVKLAAPQIRKAMWVAVAPDGKLVWTSSGGDLLAYRSSDIRPADAAPGHRALRAVRRLRGAVPPSGITGAAFYRGRLLVAGQSGDLMRVWSIDVANGSRRLEIQRRIIGESEGLDAFSAAGGALHWLVTPFQTNGRPPTYTPLKSTLLHFAPVGTRH